MFNRPLFNRSFYNSPEYGRPTVIIPGFPNPNGELPDPPMVQWLKQFPPNPGDMTPEQMRNAIPMPLLGTAEYAAFSEQLRRAQYGNQGIEPSPVYNPISFPPYRSINTRSPQPASYPQFQLPQRTYNPNPPQAPMLPINRSPIAISSNNNLRPAVAAHQQTMQRRDMAAANNINPYLKRR